MIPSLANLTLHRCVPTNVTLQEALLGKLEPDLDAEEAFDELGRPITQMTWSEHCGICFQSIREDSKLPDGTPWVAAGGAGAFVRSVCRNEHVFHTGCIKKWLNSGANTATQCPECREPILNHIREIRMPAPQTDPVPAPEPVPEQPAQFAPPERYVPWQVDTDDITNRWYYQQRLNYLRDTLLSVNVRLPTDEISWMAPLNIVGYIDMLIQANDANELTFTRARELFQSMIDQYRELGDGLTASSRNSVDRRRKMAMIWVSNILYDARLLLPMNWMLENLIIRNKQIGGRNLGWELNWEMAPQRDGFAALRGLVRERSEDNSGPANQSQRIIDAVGR